MKSLFHIKISPITILNFLGIWLALEIASALNAYSILTYIRNPQQAYWSQTYQATIIAELFVALGVSFLNVRNREKSDLKIKDDAGNEQENRLRKKKGGAVTLFIRNFVIILAFFGLINFSYIILGQKIIPGLMWKSIFYGGIVAFTLTLLDRWLKRKKGHGLLVFQTNR
jgi:hypothetical protein